MPNIPVYLDPRGVPNVARRVNDDDLAGPLVRATADLSDVFLQRQVKLLERERQTKLSMKELEASKGSVRILEDASKLDDPLAIGPYVDAKITELRESMTANEADPDVVHRTGLMLDNYSQRLSYHAFNLADAKSDARARVASDESVLDGINTIAVLPHDESWRAALDQLEQQSRANLRGDVLNDEEYAAVTRGDRQLAARTRYQALLERDPVAAGEFIKRVGPEFGVAPESVANMELRAVSRVGDMLDAAVSSRDIAALENIAKGLPDDPMYKGMIEQARRSMQQQVSRERLTGLLGRVALGEMSVEDATKTINSGITRGLKDPVDPLSFDAFDKATFDSQIDGALREAVKRMEAYGRFGAGRPMTSAMQSYFDELVTGKLVPSVRAELGQGATRDQIDLEVIRRTVPMGLMPSYLAETFDSAKGRADMLPRAANLAKAYQDNFGTAIYNAKVNDDLRATINRYEGLITAGMDPTVAAKDAWEAAMKTDPVKEAGLAATREKDDKVADAFFAEAVDDAYWFNPDGVEHEIYGRFKTRFDNERRKTTDPELAASRAWQSLVGNIAKTEIGAEKGILKTEPVEILVKPGYSAHDILFALAEDVSEADRRGAVTNLPEGMELPKGGQAIPIPAAMSVPPVFTIQENEVAGWLDDNAVITPDRLARVIDDNGVSRPLYQVHVLDKNGSPHPILIDGKPMLWDGRYSQSNAFKSETKRILEKRKEDVRWMRGAPRADFDDTTMYPAPGF